VAVPGFMVLKQRWAPLRRQQAGRFKSEVAVRARRGEISGKLKRRRRTMLRARRTGLLYRRIAAPAWMVPAPVEAGLF
jgi:hypothetical protein